MKGYHLAIDAVGAKYGGTAVVVQEVLSAAAECAGVEHVTLYCSPQPDRRFEVPVDDRLDVRERPHEEKKMSARVAWLAGRLARTAKTDGADVLLALNGSGYGKIPTLVFAQQALPFSAEAMALASTSDRLRMFAVRTLLWNACRHADRIAVQTRSMRDVLVGRLGVAPERVVVIGTTSRRLEAGKVPARPPCASEDASREVVLYVGSEAPYKNLRVLPPAMVLVRRAFPRAQLFATLPVGHELESDDVVCLGYLDDKALAMSYIQADVLVFPSLVESAGLPLVEAMSFGVPVVAADRPYAHDICGDAALYFDPYQPTALADAVLAVFRNDVLRSKLRHKGLDRAEELRAARPYQRLIELAVSLPQDRPLAARDVGRRVG
jgi:glycosyltransferase involved in cell wall biosynthesis